MEFLSMPFYTVIIMPAKYIMAIGKSLDAMMPEQQP
jgi:hypothetical protein